MNSKKFLLTLALTGATTINASGTADDSLAKDRTAAANSSTAPTDGSQRSGLLPSSYELTEAEKIEAARKAAAGGSTLLGSSHGSTTNAAATSFAHASSPTGLEVDGKDPFANADLDGNIGSTATTGTASGLARTSTAFRLQPGAAANNGTNTYAPTSGAAVVGSAGTQTSTTGDDDSDDGMGKPEFSSVE